MPQYTVCVPDMCRCMPRRNFVLNRSPQDLFNVSVKLEFLSLGLPSARVHFLGLSPSTKRHILMLVAMWHINIQLRLNFKNIETKELMVALRFISEIKDAHESFDLSCLTGTILLFTVEYLLDLAALICNVMVLLL